jgi:hypothetical protein
LVFIFRAQVLAHPNLRIAEVALSFWDDLVMYRNQPRSPVWQDHFMRVVTVIVRQSRRAPEVADLWDIGDEYVWEQPSAHKR